MEQDFVNPVVFKLKTQFFNCVLSLSKSNPPPTPHPVLSTRCFSGYSCRLVTHGMSLIIVNEDSLDVSTASSYSVWWTAYRFVQYWGFMCVFVYAQGGGQLCGGVLSRLLWELGCGPQPDWWVGLFVCSQVQIIKVSGVPSEKGMKWDNLNYHFFPSLSFTTSHTVLHFTHTGCTFSLAVFFLLLSVRSDASCMSRFNFSPSYVFFAFRFNVWLLSLSGSITVMCVRICLSLSHTPPKPTCVLSRSNVYTLTRTQSQCVPFYSLFIRETGGIMPHKF